MAEIPQSFDNHTRWHPPFHFFLMPLFLLNVVFALVQLIRFHDLDHAVWFALAIAAVVLTFITRTNSLRVQDRVIRLEERLRYQQVLSPALAQRAADLSPRQIVALRFASDDELGELAQQVLDGRLIEGKEIKRAIRRWRPDRLRV
jgi:hypothetical protein